MRAFYLLNTKISNTSTFCQPRTVFPLSSNLLSFMAPRHNTLRTKHVCIEEFTVGAISNYAPGQTVIND